MKTVRDLKRYSSLILVVLLLMGTFSVRAAINYPTPTSNKYLNDYAGVVNQKSANQIIALGNELEKQTGAQAIVVTVTTLEGVPIEDYANTLFRKWGIGQARKDNGLLILLAVNDKQWRVEVGRGLEGVLPDALTNRVMMALGKNDFIAGKYGQGLANTYSVFCDEIATEYGVTLAHSLHVMPPTRNNAAKGYQRSYIPYFLITGLLIIDLFFNRGRLLRLILQMLFWSNLSGRNRNRRGGGNGGGFGGGSSNGGGSSGGW